MSSSTAQASQPPDGKDVTQEQKDLQRSAEKGKAPVIEVEETDLMDLKAKDMEKPLEVKVYRKWTSRNVPDPNPTGLCFMLLDRKVSPPKFFVFSVQNLNKETEIDMKPVPLKTELLIGFCHTSKCTVMGHAAIRYKHASGIVLQD